MHHVRQSLSLADLNQAVALFSKNIHDESLPVSIQTMSCKLLLNLVECIRTKNEQDVTHSKVRVFIHLDVKADCDSWLLLFLGARSVYENARGLRAEVQNDSGDPHALLPTEDVSSSIFEEDKKLTRVNTNSCCCSKQQEAKNAAASSSSASQASSASSSAGASSGDKSSASDTSVSGGNGDSNSQTTGSVPSTPLPATPVASLTDVKSSKEDVKEETPKTATSGEKEKDEKEVGS